MECSLHLTIHFYKRFNIMIDKYILADKAALIENGIKKIESISNAVIEPESVVAVNERPASILFDSALNSPFNSVQELNAKKVMATAMLIAKSKGILPEESFNKLDGISAASIADEAISRMKVAFQTSVGNIDVYEGADILIDKATARAMAVSDVLVAKGMDVAINKVATVVAKSYPPLLPVVQMVKYCQPYITEKAQQCVRAGIQSLNKVAKTSIRKVGDFIKSKVTSKIFSK